jgi:hypothetical protein
MGLKSAHAAPRFEGGDHLPLRATPIAFPKVVAGPIGPFLSDSFFESCSNSLYFELDHMKFTLVAA